MTHFEDKMNYQLAQRLNLLPRTVYKNIREDFNHLPKSSAQRWRTLINDLAADIRAREAQVIINHVGCSLEELMNPGVNLQAIYLERKQKPAMDEVAARYKLVDS